MALTPLPIRLLCDVAAPTQLNDINRSSQPPVFYRGDDIEFDIGLASGGALLAGLSGSGAGGIASVTLQIFEEENDTNPPMIASTVLSANMNLGLTQTEWNNNTAPYFHAAFVIPNAQTSISLGGAASVNYWLRITAQTSDSPEKNITFLDGPIAVRDGPISTATAPTPAYFRFWSVGGNIVPQIYDPVAAGYRTLAVTEDGGIPTLQLSDTVY